MDFKELISVVGYGIETVGVLIIAVGCMAASFRFLSHFRKETKGSAYGIYRRQLGRSIILGLEVLIAGDIIRTVIVADTFKLQRKIREKLMDYYKQGKQSKEEKMNAIVDIILNIKKDNFGFMSPKLK